MLWKTKVFKTKGLGRTLALDSPKNLSHTRLLDTATSLSKRFKKMTLGYVLIRDGLLSNEVLVKYNLCEKALNVLLRVMAPQNLTRWFTEAELRKNTRIQAGEIRIITSIGHRIGFLEEKYENGKIKFKFDTKIFSLSEEQFNDALHSIKVENLSDDIVRVIQLYDYKLTQKAQRKEFKLNAARETVPQEILEHTAEVTRPRGFRKSSIDDPETVTIYGLQKAMDSGTLNKKTALDLHNEGACEGYVEGRTNNCGFCMLKYMQNSQGN